VLTDLVHTQVGFLTLLETLALLEQQVKQAQVAQQDHKVLVV
jgi:hypothetical protein